MLPSETMIWQPEFTDKTLSRKPGAVQFTRTNITRITDFLEKTGYVKRTDSREDRRAKKISLTSEGMFFIQRLTLAQSMYLKEIWGYLTHDEQELFEVINKKLLAHLDDVSS
ncbi:MarR family transcriptional regulator [Escherichia coli]|uniref:MarR family transcriptional regulator n=1 Tax=Escherichia coli TaxID=562 RepID=UPI0019D11243